MGDFLCSDDQFLQAQSHIHIQLHIPSCVVYNFIHKNVEAIIKHVNHARNRVGCNCIELNEFNIIYYIDIIQALR